MVWLHDPLDELRTARLDRTWYARDALVLGRALIGCFLVHELAREEGASPRVRVSRIVETEAYRGPRDLACHARAGLTNRTRTLLGEHGHAYVFFVYGMHDCFNVTCRGPGWGHAVLVRAGEPTFGFEPGTSLAGPGRLARGLGITRALDGADLAGNRHRLYLCPRTAGVYVGARAGRPRIAVTPRVGVAYAGHWADRPWRFLDPASKHVSKPPRSAIGR